MMRLEHGEFREAVNRAAADIPIELRVRAAEMLIADRRDDGRPLRPTDVGRAVEWARRLAAIVREAEREGGPTPAQLPESPASKMSERVVLDTLERRVQAERSAIFGDPRQPFSPSRYDEALTWIDDRIREQEARYPDPNGLSDEAMRLKRELGHAAKALSRLTGRLTFSGSSDEAPLRYIGRDESGGPYLRRVRLSGSASAPLRRIADLAREAAGVGLFEEDVVIWILCGVRPKLHRAVVAGGINCIHRDASDPAGLSELEVPYVQVRVYTPDLRHTDLRSLHGSIRSMWSRVEDDLAPAEIVAPGVWRAVRVGEGRRGAVTFTPRDALLLEVVESLGGRPDEVPAGFWEAVAREWDARGRFPPRSPGSHGRQWRRLNQKLERNPQREDSHA